MTQRARHFAGPELSVAALLAVVAGIAAWGASMTSALPHQAPVARVPLTPDAPPVPPPAVEPLLLLDTPPETARAINAAIPFVAGPVTPARPFAFVGAPADRARATVCLAAAQLYEAGDDRAGQEAVAQVVLNRLRHPVYPKTVCGVVFEGAERATGCQFTFTCDGALARTPPPSAWNRALTVADRALSGAVDQAVGTATHYHTDWVAPYWSGTLDKIAVVGTHLFHRWRGWWGTRAAFTGRQVGGEALHPRLAGALGRLIDPALLDGIMPLAPSPAALVSLPVAGVPARALRGSAVRVVDEAVPIYALTFDGEGDPDAWPSIATALCRARVGCTVLGWIEAAATPAQAPIPLAKQRSATFHYRVRGGTAGAYAYWNCGQVRRADWEECFPGTEPQSAEARSAEAVPEPEDDIAPPDAPRRRPGAG